METTFWAALPQIPQTAWSATSSGSQGLEEIGFLPLDGCVSEIGNELTFL